MNRLVTTLLWCCLAVASLGVMAAPVPPPRQTDVFVSGLDGYHTYRIPSVVAATNGTLLAFCEGRKNSTSDTGAIDLLLKRSTNGGVSWLPQQVIWSDPGNVCGNPAPVVDAETGVVWLLMTWNAGPDSEDAITEGTSAKSRRVYIASSADNGQTWTTPREITAEVKRQDWGWYATGPVNGIQLQRGQHRGRLVIPANHSEPGASGKKASRSHLIYSDDHGATWHIGGIEEELTNESTVTELSDGRLLHNMRSYSGKNLRAVATSSDGGLTWSGVRLDPHLPEPVCQGALLRHSWPTNGHPGCVLFANPASHKREKMTVRASFDDCENWSVKQILHTGPSAYSCLVNLPDQSIGCLFECGEKNPYERIVFTTFTLDWLQGKTDGL
jgi:sialidase-1